MVSRDRVMPTTVERVKAGLKNMYHWCGIDDGVCDETDCPFFDEWSCRSKLAERAIEVIEQLEKDLAERNALLAVMGITVPENRERKRK